ncbi:MAG: von Willebrand factor type A domain-containing protein [Planctomyces sp.]|nr:von Willebrand factor type A domain-containing protein [Planctomyces sp.]
MNEHSHKPSIESELEARIVALVLGEASDFEREELTRLMESRPELEAFKLQIELMHGLLRDVGAGESTVPEDDWKLPADRRNSVLGVIRGDSAVQLTELEGNAVNSAHEFVAASAGHMAVAGHSPDLKSERVSGDTLVPEPAHQLGSGSARLTITGRVIALSKTSAIRRLAAVVCIAGLLMVLSLSRQTFNLRKPSAGFYDLARTDVPPADMNGNRLFGGTGIVFTGEPASLDGVTVLSRGDSLHKAAQSEGPASALSAIRETVGTATLPSPMYLEDQIEYFAETPALTPPEFAATQPQSLPILAPEQEVTRDSGLLNSSPMIRLQTAAPDVAATDSDRLNSLRSDVDLSDAKKSGEQSQRSSPALGIESKEIMPLESAKVDVAFEDASEEASEEARRAIVPASPLDREGDLLEEALIEQRGKSKQQPGEPLPKMPSRSSLDGADASGPQKPSDKWAIELPPVTHGDALSGDIDGEKLHQDLGGDAAKADEKPEAIEKWSDQNGSDVDSNIQEADGTKPIYPAFGSRQLTFPGEKREIARGTEPQQQDQPAGADSLKLSEELSKKQNEVPLQITDFESSDTKGTQWGRGLGESEGREYKSLAEFDKVVGRGGRFGFGATASAGLNETATAEEVFSTFSLHVSDVSFKLAQAALSRGEWPEATKIRVEEFVNAFDYGDPLPSRGERVACRVEQSIHPFLQQRNLLRISMRTAAMGRSANTPLRLTFLLDNSGSMERADRQETVRHAFALLAQQLTPLDQVTLISFARQPRLLADKVSGNESETLVLLIDELPSEGGTNIEAALQLAFEKASEQQSLDGQNRVILLTDGAVNLGNADPESLSRMVISMRTKGIAFDAAGISADGLNDEVLEALTRKGDGRYYLLDSVASADDSFVRQIAGALRPSAKNVKVQVEFNPKRVGHFKLLGFEKHLLETEDFRNDAVDAAELTAAEAGVALYHFEAKPDGEGDVGSVSVRFRDLSTGEMVENRWPIPYEPAAPRIDQATPSLRIAASAAMLAAKLRGEPLGDAVDLQALSQTLSALPDAQRNDVRVQELIQMIEQARQLQGR